MERGEKFISRLSQDLFEDLAYVFDQMAKLFDVTPIFCRKPQPNLCNWDYSKNELARTREKRPITRAASKGF